jgi:hypothetical protein
MDVVDDIMTYIEISLGTSNHHSLLPPSERTFGSGSCNAFIHKSSVHCSSSRLSVLLLDCFLVSSYQAGNLVIIDVMTGCSGFFFLSWNLHVFLYLLGPWNFL